MSKAKQEKPFEAVTSCLGNLFWLTAIIVLTFKLGSEVFHNLRLSPSEHNATATARTLKRTSQAKATATVTVCKNRQTRQWCLSRRKWSGDTEAKLSALLKAVGGLDALTAKEQDQVQEIERELAFFRRTCEGEVDIITDLQEAFTSDTSAEQEFKQYLSEC